MSSLLSLYTISLFLYSSRPSISNLSLFFLTFLYFLFLFFSIFYLLSFRLCSFKYYLSSQSSLLKITFYLFFPFILFICLISPAFFLLLFLPLTSLPFSFTYFSLFFFYSFFSFSSFGNLYSLYFLFFAAFSLEVLRDSLWRKYCITYMIPKTYIFAYIFG